MEPMINDDVVRGVVLWTGWKTSPKPLRDDDLIVSVFGNNGYDVLSQIKQLEDVFYSSRAHLVATNVAEMEMMAIGDFVFIYPEAAFDVCHAFAWCYSYDYK